MRKIKPYLTGESRLYAKRGNWDGYVGKVEKSLGRFLICSHSGGSKRKPYYAFSTLVDNQSRNLNNWEEKCLESIQIFICHDPWAVKTIEAGFNISEHAIERIYQRSISSDQLRENSNDAHIVFEELEFCPMWASYWINFGIQAFKKSDINIFYPIIPSVNGLFLGEMYRDKLNRIEVRTFVDDSLLSPVQFYLKKEMLSLSLDFMLTPMSLLLAFMIVGMVGKTDVFSEFHARVLPLSGILAAQIVVPDCLELSFSNIFE